MEFKVFKNENNKILKEYWLTPSEWETLDKTTVQDGDIYHIVGTIDKGDLSADVNASLAKGDSSLQKPTATLAKESFVKVGIDGSQKFDENSYVVAPSVDGTAGQVLKKTASGTEWADESGGGKLYFHKVNVDAGGVPVFKFKFISTSNTLITKDNIYESDLPKIAFDMFLSGDSESVVPPVTYIAINFSATPDSVSVFYLKTYPTDSISSMDIGSGGNYSVTDTVTEL